MKHDRINLGAMTVTKAEIRFKGLSKINKNDLIKVIEEHSVKLNIDKKSLIDSIKAANQDSVMLTLFGLGSNDFLIGQTAQDRYDRESVIREGEDNAVAH